MAPPPTPSPWQTIWLQPRATVRRLVTENPEYAVLWLAALAGIARSLDRASMRNAGDHMPMGVIIALACLLGPLGGLFTLWISSYLVEWTGSWLGGTASRQHIKTALAWALVPNVCGLALWVPELVLVGPEMFTSETPRLEASMPLAIALTVLATAELGLGVWSVVLLCHTVAEVQSFVSAWRGLGNVLLAGLVLLVPLVLLGVMLAVVLR